ncbi:DUF2142 domain-containing protein [Paucibacter sp. B2R-40]|uniref:DUF2142 domain-containing protein n=1 Tax=Paucibacter sp. B2R-40 TaxID=2893554 RepID=UPI0021E3C96C|nr:DUF2142 domain-containing protein [Paucibacter sp. B2R-40]MCV2353665.1 DUF2142 domain-containing protein [Paucibacter sp. B2R-40]
MTNRYFQDFYASFPARKHAIFYLLFGGISICLLVFLTPPFEVPDEPQHFYRSYQLSHFDEVDRVKSKRIDLDLPASIPGLVMHFMGTTEFHAPRKPPQRSLTEIFKKLGDPVDEDLRVNIDFSGIQANSPLPYLPQAMAIAAVRSVGWGPLEMLYAGRLVNALSAIIITTVAIALLPVGRTFALIVALLPMTQFQTASVSPDALTISGALLFTALMARFLAKLNWTWKQQLATILAGLLMCSVKPVLAPLLFAGLWLGSHTRNSVFVSAKRVFATQFILAAITVSLIAIWFLLVPKPHTTTLGTPVGVDSSGQVAYLMEHPLTAARIPLRSLYLYAGSRWQSTIGKLGWLNVHLNSWVYILSGIAMLLGLYAERAKARVNVSSSFWIAFLSITAIFMVEWALYIIWTPVGAYAAEGVQGRYFLPILPMAGVAGVTLIQRCSLRKFRQHATYCVVAILIATTLSMHRTIIGVYGLF